MTTNLTDPQAPVTDEELDQMIWKLERDGGMTPKLLSLMKELREVRKAKGEPVAWLYSASFERGHVEGEMTDAPGCDIPIYTEPPSPVSIPGELTHEEYKRRFMEEDDFDDTYRGGWNACRAAMLQAGNSQATPDGWIPVSERMPDKLIPVMVMYADGEIWSAMWSGQFWDDGCTIPDPHAITHWREMPAAPQQGVKSALEMGVARYGGAMQQLADDGD